MTMNRLHKKVEHQQLRQHRVRAKLTGTAERPRLSIHISNVHVSAQLIDDVAGNTLASVSTAGKKTAVKGTMTEKATWVGEQIAAQAASKKVSHVIFDRGPKLYHGRIKALADAAREKGLKF